MAIMSPGPLAGAISGDVGGICFSNPAGSMVVRKKRRQNSLSSRTNSLNQSNMMIITNGWRSLSEENKKTWRNEAQNLTFSNRLGISRQLSGYQYFMKYNLIRSRVLAGFATIPIASPEVGNSGAPTVTSDVTNGIRIQFLDEVTPPSLQINVYGRNLFRSTLIKFNGTDTFIAPFNPGIPADFFINFDWDNKIGLPVLNQLIYVRMVLTDSANFQPHTTYTAFALTTA